ncbi:MAG: DUF87 domain-containing protein [Ktedonobacteraceae bacterium]|nr:DUF87 domain-containing protein [Ktedonobacteraceae bacterium]
MGTHDNNNNKNVGRLGVAAATLVAAEAGLAHFGAPGVLVGLVASWAAYEYSAPLVAKLPAGGRKSPQPGQDERKTRKHSLAYRLLNGKSAREEEASFADEEVIEDELEEGALNLGPQLRPHINTVLSSRMAILGQPGMGKSNVVGDLSEELADFDVPLLIFDQKPEYGPLCERPYLRNPFKASAANVTPQSAFQFGVQIMNERLQVVLDLRSYRNDTTAAKVMIMILAGIWAWEEAHANEDRIPCMIILEEAHYWLPQKEAMSTVSKQSKDGEPSIFSKLQQTFFSLVTGGRSMGMGCVIVTQRPADIDKRAIAVADWKILLRADMPQDLQVYRALGCSDEIARSLEVGQAYITGPGTKGVYQFRERFSPSEAKTPGYEALKKETPSSVPIVPRSQTEPLFELGNTPGNTGMGNGEHAPDFGEQPGKPFPESGNSGERSREPGNIPEDAGNVPEGYTHEEEMKVILAYAALSQSGEPVTRRRIHDFLGWGNRDYSRVVKPVCDKHNIDRK